VAAGKVDVVVGHAVGGDAGETADGAGPADGLRAVAELDGQPGFLTGAAGTALALVEYGQLPSHAVPDRWDCVLLLS
jgi:hypothetical protein